MKVEISVPGGLGNQLFSFVAGLYFAMKLEGSLEINLRDVDYKHGNDTFLELIGASPRQLSAYGITVRRRDFTHNYMMNLANGKIRRYKLESFFYPKTLFIHEDESLYPFQKSEIDSRLIEALVQQRNIRKIRVDGYFQDFSYLDEVKSRFSTFQTHGLFSPFTELKGQTQRPQDPNKPICAIHIRLGDFRIHLSKSYGLLSPDYYLDIMNDLRRVDDKLRFVIYSDEIQVAKKIYSELDRADVDWFGINSQGHQNKAVETFWKMSEANYFILGNSTFGFWSAVMASNSKRVFYPWPMYKVSSSKGILSIPKTWEQIKSRFI